MVPLPLQGCLQAGSNGIIGELVAMESPRPHPRPGESESAFNKMPRQFISTPEFEWD